jgi:hypothetical protein
MRRCLVWSLPLAASIAIVIAATAIAAEKPAVIRVGNVILTLNGRVSPVALPENTPAPITLSVSGSIATADGSQPPALKEVIVETAKDGYINPTGLPACAAGKLESEDTKAAEKACRRSIVGRGHTTVRVAFPESAPFYAQGPVVAFNGGKKGGVTTLFLQAYVAVPTPTAIVTTLKIKKVHNGPYGLRSVATIPVIAGGGGSLTKFNLTLHRLFTYKGKTQSYLEGKCSNDSLLAKADAIFADGSTITGVLVRPCKVKN